MIILVNLFFYIHSTCAAFKGSFAFTFSPGTNTVLKIYCTLTELFSISKFYVWVICINLSLIFSATSHFPERYLDIFTGLHIF